MFIDSADYSELTLTIPKDSCFEIVTDGSTTAYEAVHDINIKADRTWVFFRMADQHYVACANAEIKPEGIAMGVYCIQTSTTNQVQTEVRRVADLDMANSHTLSIGSSVKIQSSGLRLVSTANLQFWSVDYEITGGDIGFKYQRADNLDLKPDHVILTQITRDYFHKESVKRYLCIPANTKVYFDARQYLTCHDILVYFTGSLIGSRDCTIHYHLNGVIREPQANPFQDSNITPKIQLIYQDKYCVMVDGADFAAKITECSFSTKNIAFTDHSYNVHTHKHSACALPTFEWVKSDAIQQLHMWKILSRKGYHDRMRHWQADSFANFCNMAFQVAAELGDVENLRVLQDFELDLTSQYDTVVRTAIKMGNMTTLKYFADQGCLTSADYESYLKLAKDCRQSAVVSYLENHPLAQAFQRAQVLDEIQQIQQRMHNLCQMLTNKC